MDWLPIFWKGGLPGHSTVRAGRIFKPPQLEALMSGNPASLLSGLLYTNGEKLGSY